MKAQMNGGPGLERQGYPGPPWFPTCGAGLIRDEDAQAFHGPNRELADSRNHFVLRYLMGPPREEWIRREYHEDE